MMNKPMTSLDDLSFKLVGEDPLSQTFPRSIAREERLLARSTSFLIVLILTIQFIATAMSVHDIFIDQREALSLPLYLILIVMPVSMLWTLILFGLLRFTGHAVYEQGKFGWRMMGRFLLAAPIWFIFPLMGFMAAIPFQTRIFLHDVQIESMIENWNRVAPQLIDLEFRSLDRGKDLTPFGTCVKELMKFEVLFNPGESLQKIGECEDAISNDADASLDHETSQQALTLLRTALSSDGLIAKASKIYKVAPVESLILALPIMLLYFSPYLIRLLARRRAFEYVLHDLNRLRLAKSHQIELHAHDAFDAHGVAVPIHRYRGFERMAELQRQSHEKEIELEQDRQKQEWLRVKSQMTQNASPDRENT